MAPDPALRAAYDDAYGAYHRLFDSAADNKVSPEVRSKREQQRALRRKVLLPVIRGLPRRRQVRGHVDVLTRFAR